MKINSKIKSFFKPSWEKASYAAALVCAFLMLEFRTTVPQKVLPSTLRASVAPMAPKKLPPLPHSLEALKQEVEAAKAAAEEAIEKDVAKGDVSQEPVGEDTKPTTEAPEVAMINDEADDRDLGLDPASKKETAPPVAVKAPSKEAFWKPTKISHDTKPATQHVLKKERAVAAAPVRIAENSLYEAVPLTLPAVELQSDSQNVASVDSEWDEASVETEAVDITSPLEQITETAFDEPTLSAATGMDRLTSEASEGAFEKNSEPQIALEKRIGEVVGNYQKNDFAEIRENLATLKDAVTTLQIPTAPYGAPEPTTAVATVKPEPQLVKKPLVAKASPAEGSYRNNDEPVVTPGSESKTAEPEAKPSVEPAHVKPEEADPDDEDENDDIVEAKAAPAETSGPGEATVVKKQGDDASFGDFHLGKEDAPASADKKKLATQQPVPQLVTPSLPRANEQWIISQKKQAKEKEESEEDLSDTSEEGSKLLGKLELDPGMESWLEANKGHVELYLHPEWSREPQDTLFLDYEYPSENFQIDGKLLSGKYRLFAGIYVPSSPTPVAQLAYNKTVSTANVRDFIHFGVRKQDFLAQRAQQRPSSTDGVVLAGTLFEGIVGDPKNPKPLANGEVSVVGHPEYGTFKTDRDGNFRVANVSIPVNSEVPLEVKAPGYYKSKIIYTTSSTPLTYRTIYLLGTETVKNITKYFLGKEQRPGQGVIAGTIYNEKRKPQEGIEVTLSAKKGHAIPLGAIPHPEEEKTSNNGQFFIPYVTPFPRAVQRSDGSPSMLVDVMPDEGTYLELGRGGKKKLRVRVKTATGAALPPTTVELSGDPKSAVAVNPDGTATFENIDFPPGIVTVQIKAKGFPITLHTIPWNIRDRDVEHQMFVMDGSTVKESIEEVAQKKIPAGTGILLGQINSYLFKNPDQCIHVTVKDLVTGRPVSPESGTFRFSPAARTNAKAGCFYQDNAGFTAILNSGDYIAEFIDEDGKLLGEHVQRVGVGRVSILFPNAMGKI